jgi:hypothetical protein
MIAALIPRKKISKKVRAPGEIEVEKAQDNHDRPSAFT